MALGEILAFLLCALFAFTLVVALVAVVHRLWQQARGARWWQGRP